MGKVDSSNCNYCAVRDYVEHFFCECIVVRQIWQLAEQKIESICGYHITLSDINKLFGVKSIDVPSCYCREINTIILIVKMCISKFKYGSYHDMCSLFEHELKLREFQFQYL